MSVEAVELTVEAKKLHETMLVRGKGVYTQQELVELCGFEDTAHFMEHAQIILNKGLMKLMEQSESNEDGEKQVLFSPVSEQEAAKIKNMNSDEAIVYSHIEASGREGIWTKTIKAKTNLHQHIVLRCLKSLESQSYIKSVKSVKFPTRKIYMLYHLTPSIDVTGGPWFTDSELDTDFIDSLLIVIWKFVAQKTYPQCFRNRGFLPNGLKQYSYPAEQINGMGSILPNLNEINSFIVKSGITTVDLTLVDVKSLCTVLEYDEKLEEIAGGRYRATWQSVLEAGGGKVVGEEVYKPQDDVTFNILDSYRVMDTNEEESNSASDPTGRLYLDSWIAL